MASSPELATLPSLSSDSISSTSSHHHNRPTVIIVVFVSLGCVFFLCFCFFVLWFLIKRRCKRCKKMAQETEIIRADEHFKMKEDIVKGPCGPQAVVLSIEKDKHFEEKIIKNERELEGELMQGKTGEITTTTDLESGESCSSSHHHGQYKS